MQLESKFQPGVYVELDPFSANPLADDLRQVSPTAYRQATTEAPVPRMFDDGTADLPAFTASGLPPELLRGVVYSQRHAVAAIPTLDAAYRWVQDYGRDVGYIGDCDGWVDAVQRMKDWAAGNTEAARAAQARKAEISQAEGAVSWLQGQVNAANAAARALRGGEL
jgi:hypothetical protein